MSYIFVYSSTQFRHWNNPRLLKSFSSKLLLHSRIVRAYSKEKNNNCKDFLLEINQSFAMDTQILEKPSSPIVDPNVSIGDIEDLTAPRDPHLKKSFNLWNTLAIQCSITSTPLAIGTYLAVVIGVGGSPVFFFGYLLSCVMGLIVCISLCEIAAVLPHSSGKHSKHGQ